MSGVGKGGRYPAELRERAVRMVFEHQDEYASQWKAIGQSATSPASPTTRTAAKSLVSARVIVPSKTMAAGSTMDAQVVIRNDSGHALSVIGCGSLFQVVLANDAVNQEPAWTLCAKPISVPIGVSKYSVPVAASYLKCSAAGPAPLCIANRPPPLPPGVYKAKFFQNPTVARTPPPTTIRVTA